MLRGGGGAFFSRVDMVEACDLSMLMYAAESDVWLFNKVI